MSITSFVKLRWLINNLIKLLLVIIPCLAMAQPQQQSQQQHPDSCRTPGLADSYVLALSWQPAFCERHSHKPECQGTSHNSGFTLHGLWPNASSCGRSYSFCGAVRKRSGGMCSLPAVPMSESTRAELRQRMPGATAASCLERHQWHKHGVCQNRLSADQYFRRAITLTDQFNNAGFARFMREHSGQRVNTDQLLQLFDQAFGRSMHRRLTLQCRKGNLVEIRIALPASAVQPGLNLQLKELVKQARDGYHNGCGRQFRVDD